jgi:4-amino-4-deoxy-L-arabinose transferase-like glycosyltransferase
MMLDPCLDALARGWRGRLFAALVALIAGLPGLAGLPPLDRDEARFAQSTAQMLESGDLLDVRFQEEPRPREPIALHWLQAASVSVLSSADARQIWAYRIPSLLGAMLAAAACAWGAGAVFGPARGALAGAMLGGCLLLSTEAGIGRADALLCGAITLALAAFSRLYGAAGGGEEAGRGTRLAFWLGLALAILDEGVVGPVIVATTMAALWIWDRRAPWLRIMGWSWGLILLVALVGPWIAVVTVRTDGGAWARGSAESVAGVGPTGWAPPGLGLLTAPILLFPFAALLPAALVAAWKARAEPGPRFALCWLIPNWLMLEVGPIRLIHQALPLYGAMAWLAAFALTRPIGPVSRWVGAALSMLTAAAVAVAALFLAQTFSGGSSMAPAVWAAAFSLGAGLAGALVLTSRPRLPMLGVAAALGVTAHGVLLAGVIPSLTPLQLPERTLALLDQAGIDPRRGLAPGPVTVVGFDEPSLVFLLGSETEFGEAGDAAQAISEGRPAVVEQTAVADFQHALSAAGLTAVKVGAIAGVDYVDGEAPLLSVYRAESPPPPRMTGDAGHAGGAETPPGPAPAPPAPKPSHKRTS